METITVTISNGDAVITTDGFKGAACLKATLALEQALGFKTDDTPTSEMRLAPAAAAAVTTR